MADTADARSILSRPANRLFKRDVFMEVWVEWVRPSVFERPNGIVFATCKQIYVLNFDKCPPINRPRNFGPGPAI